jgi:CrcB protein
MLWASIGAVVVVGFAGGLSTFSSYAAQTVEFFRRGRIAQGLINTVLNLLITPLAVWFGAMAALALLK